MLFNNGIQYCDGKTAGTNGTWKRDIPYKTSEIKRRREIRNLYKD